MQSESSGIKLNSVFEAASPVELFLSPDAVPDIDFNNLGLLGKIVSRPCLFEYFRFPPTEDDICNCMLQLFTWQKKLYQKAEQEGKEPPTKEVLPHLWVIIASPTEALLETFLEEFGTNPNFSDWYQGVYFLDDEFKTSLIAINQLPVTPDTLWLRMLGRGTILEQAVNEFLAFPEDYPLRNRVVKLVGNWCAETEGEEELAEEDKEFLRLLSPIYQQWQEGMASLD